MPFILLAATGKGQNLTGAAEAMLTTSDQIPAAQRTLFAVVRETDRAHQQAQQQKGATQREVDLAEFLLNDRIDIKTTAGADDLSQNPRMVFMLNKLSDPELRESITNKLKGVAAERNPSAAAPVGNRRAQRS